MTSNHYETQCLAECPTEMQIKGEWAQKFGKVRFAAAIDNIVFDRLCN